VTKKEVFMPLLMQTAKVKKENTTHGKSQEIDQLIPDPILNKTAKTYYNVVQRGNWEKEKNVLYVDRNIEKTAKALHVDLKKLSEQLIQINTILKNARDKRIPPTRDDKILTSWNTYMSKAYIDAYTATGEKQFLDRARKNLDFITSKVIQKDGLLFRNYKNGKASINGFLDDYAFSVQALIALYQVSFEEKYLNSAKLISDYAIKHFFDTNTQTFYFSDDSNSKLISRKN
jgi:uncharacterized protein YyaL (SSP411 family)